MTSALSLIAHFQLPEVSTVKVSLAVEQARHPVPATMLTWIAHVQRQLALAVNAAALQPLEQAG